MSERKIIIKVQNLSQFMTTTSNTNKVIANRPVNKNFLRNRIHFYFTEPPLSTDFDIMDKIIFEDESDLSIGIFYFLGYYKTIQTVTLVTYMDCIIGTNTMCQTGQLVKSVKIEKIIIKIICFMHEKNMF